MLRRGTGDASSPLHLACAHVREAAALVLCCARRRRSHHTRTACTVCLFRQCALAYMCARASVRCCASLACTAGLGSRVTVPASSIGWHAADLAGFERTTAPSKDCRPRPQTSLDSALSSARLGLADPTVLVQHAGPSRCAAKCMTGRAQAHTKLDTGQETGIGVYVRTQVSLDCHDSGQSRAGPNHAKGTQPQIWYKLRSTRFAQPQVPSPGGAHVCHHANGVRTTDVRLIHQ